MRPIIIYQKEVEDDKIVLTKEEFEKYLEDAYQAGYADGSNSLTAKGVTWTTRDSTDIDAYEKMPYWMRPDYKAPEFTCNSTPVDSYCKDARIY